MRNKKRKRENNAISIDIFVCLEAKDGLYAGYCGAIPIPGCWYWYSIGGSKKSAIPNTRPKPKDKGNAAIRNK